MNKTIYQEIDETLYTFTHSSGLRVQIVPKPGYYKKFAIFSVDFGSINKRFIIPGQQKITEVPGGVAHFLEHKLFEQEDGNVMDRYAALGASSNAATSFSRTYYYFTCTDCFAQCLALLLHFVLHPYITEESVEKEKGIISQEINMYLDSPDFVVSMNLLRLLFHNNPVREDIAGSVEDVMHTTADILRLCHSTFYSPDNMVLTVVGDVSPEEVASIVRDQIPGERRAGTLQRIFDEEPASLAGTSQIVRMDVATPLFNIGFKDHALRYTGMERVRRELAGTILKDMLFGRSSAFFEDLYNRGLINQEFYADYDIERDYAMAGLGGESKDPETVRELVAQYLQRCKRDGFNRADFEMLRNAYAGRLLKRLNVPETIGKQFSALYLQGISGFDYFSACGTITFDEINQVFEEVFLQDMAISVVLSK